MVLGGHTSIPNPTGNFKNAFSGTSSSGYGIANALVNITFSYAGYENAFNVLGEIKDPIRTVKKAAPVALSLVSVLYIFCNVAYFAAIPKAEIFESKTVTATLFFRKVFGEKAAQGLTILPVLSAFGNLISVLIGQTRMIREVGRQGVLPFPKFWVTTWPFGTPLGPILLKLAMTIIMIVAPPAGEAFNFVVSLSTWPSSFFLVFMAIGLFIIRRTRTKAGIPRGSFSLWWPFILLYIASKIFLLAVPFVPPPGGVNAGQFSFFYATPALTGAGIIIFCIIYYYVWVYGIPMWKGYELRQSVLELPDGSITHALIRVNNEDLAEWDATHDASGRSLHESSPSTSHSELSGVTEEKV